MLEPPEPPLPPTPEPEPANSDQEEEEEEEGETTFQETAAAPEIDKRRGRGHHKEASAGFFARISAFPRADWEKLLLYIYRLAPITDRRASGEPVNYIAKLSEPIDEDYILKEPNWGGSGKYRVRLNRTNADGKNTPVDVVEFVVENQKYPPRVAPGEWVDDPRNRRWAWAKTYYDGKEPPPAVAPAPAPAGPTITELIKGVKELKELSKEAAPPPPPPAPDPAEQFAKNVDSVAKIVEMAKPPAPAAPDNTLEKFLLTELTAERAANRDLMGKLLDRANAPAPAPPADPLRDLAMKMLEKRLEKMDEKPDSESEAARVSRMNGTQELIVELTKAVSPVLEKAMGLFTVMAAAKQAPPATRPRPPATVDVAATGTQEQAQPQQQTQEEQPQPEQPAQPTMEQAQQQILNFVLGSATPTLQQYLETGTGDEFAAWFCDSAFSLPGVPPPFNRIGGVDALKFAKQTGKTAIVEAYKKSQYWQQIAPNSEAEEKFIRFLDAFLAYDPEAESEGDND